MGREICEFKTGSKKVLQADSAAALSPPDPSHYRHGRPLDIQLTLPGHCTQTQTWPNLRLPISSADGLPDGPSGVSELFLDAERFGRVDAHEVEHNL